MDRPHQSFITSVITLCVILVSWAHLASSQPLRHVHISFPEGQQLPGQETTHQPAAAAAASTTAAALDEHVSADSNPAHLARRLLQQQIRSQICAQPSEKKKPNFIVILTDDQGWDDIGFNNPNYVKTPNLDKFIKDGILFDNFYTSPQCAQTRASLLTGRHHPRTSTMMVHGGYDFIHTDEATAGEIMSEIGYTTLQVGKWHQNDVQGYAPRDVGFQFSWHTTVMDPECLVSVNGTYADSVAASGAASKAKPADTTENFRSRSEYTQSFLVDKITSFLKSWRRFTPETRKPFFIYFPPHAIHKVHNLPDGKIRVYPQEYLNRLLNDPHYRGIPLSTLDAWANLAYLDDLLGLLFEELDKGGVAKDTYIFIMGDNGASLQVDEKGPGRQRQGAYFRMPSMMQGSKSTLFEGGIRNFLAARGPGLAGGVIDSTPVHISDILPTMLDLTGVAEDSVYHLPFDGISFKNLLVPHDPQQAIVTAGRRGSALASDRQRERFLVEMSATCWDSDAVPQLNARREVSKPQRLLNYNRGGLLNSVFGSKSWFPPGVTPPPRDRPGFKICMAVRYQDYKWWGMTGKVYRLTNGSHVELPCNEVRGPQGERLARQMSSAAKRWFSSLVAERHSFTKPTFYLGLEPWTVSNLIAEGAHERTPGSIKLFANGASGFQNLGDRMCFKLKVLQESTHDVVIIYTSHPGVIGTFKLSIGSYSSIMNGTAASIVATLPISEKMQGYAMGQFANISKSEDGLHSEACLELVDSTSWNTPVFKHLAVIRLIRRWDLEQGNANGRISTQAAEVPHAQDAEPDATATAIMAPEPTLSSERVRLTASGTSAWQELRMACGWPAGQVVLENMYSPYFAEGIEDCTECKPQV